MAWFIIIAVFLANQSKWLGSFITTSKSNSLSFTFHTAQSHKWTLSINLSIITAKQTDPWCYITPTVNPSVSPTPLSFMFCTSLAYYFSTLDFLIHLHSFSRDTQSSAFCSSMKTQCNSWPFLLFFIIILKANISSVGLFLSKKP